MIDQSEDPDSTEKDVRRGKGADAGRRHDFLFLALDCDRPTAPPIRHRIDDLDRVLIGRQSARKIAPLENGRSVLALQLADRFASGPIHAQLSRVPGRWILEDAGSSNGTYVNGNAVERAELSDGDLIEIGHTVFLFREKLAATSPVPRTFSGDELAAAPPGWATLLPALATQLERAQAIAASSISVVLRGETGTGKELSARAIHTLSQRSGELVAVNCSSVVSTLMESELFGHRKGAFTGAHENHSGIVLSAHRGTLLLDEVGDLSPAAQAAFLRVLQEGEVLQVGATRPTKVDVRLICATHRNLEALVAQNGFRPDLLARISGYTLELPPLRERREDLGLILSAILRRHLGAAAAEVSLTSEAARALFTHDWPLNIRELEKAIVAAIVLSKGAPIQLGDLPPAIKGPSALSGADQGRRAELLELLEKHQGNIAAVSREMGKARMQIQRWLERYNIAIDAFRR